MSPGDRGSGRRVGPICPLNENVLIFENWDWGLNFKMKPKIQTWGSLTCQCKGYDTQMTVKACEPLVLKVKLAKIININGWGLILFTKNTCNMKDLKIVVVMSSYNIIHISLRFYVCLDTAKTNRLQSSLKIHCTTFIQFLFQDLIKAVLLATFTVQAIWIPHLIPSISKSFSRYTIVGNSLPSSQQPCLIRGGVTYM